MKAFFRRKVQEISQETSDVWSYFFEPAEELTWLAGQSIRLEIPGAYGPLEHRFSIASAPHGKLVQVTTRLSNSPYKKSLERLRSGDEVQLYGLEGDFIWRENAQPLVFAAAGIGITPFHAMLGQLEFENKPLSATLVYGSSQDFIFKTQFDTWQENHPEFKVVYVSGRLDAKTLAEKIDDVAKKTIYISGPSAMVDDLSVALQHEFFVPQTQLIFDRFTGRLSRDG